MTWRIAAAAVAALMTLAPGRTAPTLDVTGVAPSGPTVPERLLRIAVMFGAPPRDQALVPIVLVRPDGGVINGALLDQRLWSPDRRILTLLLNPARVKTGLAAHDAAGFALRPGELVSLRIVDQPVHQWTVTAGGCVTPDIGTWRIGAPRAGTDLPLTLAFPGPIDVQSRDLIAVADASGHRVEDSANLTDAERTWVFFPAAPWAPGRLQLVVHPRLESPCGDEIEEAFEHAAGEGLGSRRAAPSRWFSIE